MQRLFQIKLDPKKVALLLSSLYIKVDQFVFQHFFSFIVVHHFMDSHDGDDGGDGGDGDDGNGLQ